VALDDSAIAAAETAMRMPDMDVLLRKEHPAASKKILPVHYYHDNTSYTALC